VELVVYRSRRDYPERLRRIRYHDPEGRRLIFMTNHMTLPAQTICDLYRLRWQVELFFKWIKQNLRIKRFFGYSENAVKTQVWIAVSVYVLVAIVRKQLNISLSLHGMLQILSVTPFDNVPLFQLLTESNNMLGKHYDPNQLNLF
jgi:IS4 transposase